MTGLPTGTVTFLFTDIEGSTSLLRALGGDFDQVVEAHGRILREAITAAGGTEVRTEGDSFFAVFPTALKGLRAAVDAQRALASHRWPNDATVRVRMGLHTGEGRLGGDDYVGLDVHLAARIADAGHGGQVLLSPTTRALVTETLPEGAALQDLGRHRLKDIEHAVHLWQLDIEGSPTEFPRLRTADEPRTNLPVQRTSFVGREAEIGEIVGLLARARLLTLTGPGGSGKTRLALEVGGRLLDRFADGVFVVDLSLVADPELVPVAIAAGLGVREEATRSLVDQVAEHLRQRELLLILDNVEQVTGAGPDVGRLLDVAPGLAVLTTSRVPLHVTGEVEFPVPPLGLPDSRDGLLPEAIGQYEAVALFIDRATEVRPDFAVTNANAPAVAEIVSRLDGLPLAIELAASRVKVLGPDALLARLAQRLPLLSGGPQDRPARQQTLRAAIDWSYDLLDERDQRLFAHLAVFSGGCTLEAAEEICEVGPEADVLDALSSLVDKSLVRRLDTDGGEARFAMLGTIREYAAERLDDREDAAEIRDRHTRFFLRLCGDAEPHLTGEDQAAWFSLLDEEHDNIRAVLARSADAGDVDTGMRIGAALWRFWQQRGHLREARTWLDRVLALPGADRRDALRVRALGALGGIAYWQNDYEPMTRAYEEAVAVAREVGEDALLGRALYDLSFVPFLSQDLESVQRIIEEAVEIARRSGDRVLLADAVASAGFAKFFGGDVDAAMEPMQEAVAIHRELGNRFFVADSMMGVAALHLAKGEPDLAHGIAAEALRMMAEGGNISGIQMGLYAMALAEVRQGEAERGARLLAASTRLREESGGGPPPELIGRIGDAEAEAKSALGERFEGAWTQGYALDADAAVAYALGDGE